MEIIAKNKKRGTSGAEDGMRSSVWLPLHRCWEVSNLRMLEDLKEKLEMEQQNGGPLEEC